MTHGTSDNAIFPQGSIDYYDRVAEAVGGIHKARKFARFFLAVGVDHLGSVNGPAAAGRLSVAPIPGGALAALIDWVENHKAPRQLLGVTDPDGLLGNSFGDIEMTRPICMYPLVARYKGHGDTNDADNFVCSKEFLPTGR